VAVGKARDLRRYEVLARRAREFLPALEGVSAPELQGLTGVFRQRLADGAVTGDLLPEAFAAVSEAARRSSGAGCSEVQLIAGAAVFSGNVAEIGDGAGKSLAAALPGYVWALAGQGVHMAMRTDWMARRHAARMAGAFGLLGLQTGLVVASSSMTQRQAGYAADITYGSYLQFGYDYLADNLVGSPQQRVQRDLGSVVVDEADSVLIDGADFPMRRSADGAPDGAIAGGRASGERRVLAEMTVRDYYRMYASLGGLTATAMPAEAEFAHFYALGVVVPVPGSATRVDHGDLLWRAGQEKLAALVEHVADRHFRGQPVVIGTLSAQACEQVSRMLDARGIGHAVLGAGQVEDAPRTMAEAGRLSQVTVLAGSEGRGHPVVLGGDADYLAWQGLGASDDSGVVFPQRRAAAFQAARDAIAPVVEANRERVIAAGGLLVLGAERSRLRRDDDWLAGLAGQRGEPGESLFYLSEQDDLLRAARGRLSDFTPARYPIVVDNSSLRGKLFRNIVESIQRRGEAACFELHRARSGFDQVDDSQRKEVYQTREAVLHGSDVRALATGIIDEVTGECVAAGRDAASLAAALRQIYPASLTASALAAACGHADSGTRLAALVSADAHAAYESRERELGPLEARARERRLILSAIDHQWSAHLASLGQIRERAWSSPLSQCESSAGYRREAGEQFAAMLQRVKRNIVRNLYREDG
jgi:preprotein translocase subunit SecA